MVYVHVCVAAQLISPPLYPHSGLPPLGQTPFPTSQPMNSYGQMSPGPSGVGYHPHIMGQHQGVCVCACVRACVHNGVYHSLQ